MQSDNNDRFSQIYVCLLQGSVNEDYMLIF